MTDHENPPAGVPAHADVSRRRLETRARLLDAATEVFAELGFQGASVEQICARADFTRGAFYSNFSSKEELFVALLTREYDRRIARIRERGAELAASLATDDMTIDLHTTAHYVTAFLDLNGTEASWFTLETEFLLLALRTPTESVRLNDFRAPFRDDLANLVESIVYAAGRQFTLPVDHALAIFDGLYDRATRASALEGPDSPDGLKNIGPRLAELIFAITEPI